MSALEESKILFQSTCATNSEPYALQNIGDMMSPEFSENCIIIVDPSMPIHHNAYVILDFEEWSTTASIASLVSSKESSKTSSISSTSRFAS